MAAVVTAEPGQIEDVSSIKATINTALLCGMIKAADGRSMIMILDPGRVIETTFGSGARRGDKIDRGETAVTALEVVQTVDEIQLVSFDVAGQEYALAIENVQEIVQVPARINRVPNTDSHVLGVVTLRNRLLQLVSLREMFGLPAVPLSEHNKIVVVPISGQTSVGIVMDTVKEVLRVNRNLIDPVPALMRAGNAQDHIQGICRINSGKRLVSVLSAAALFENEVVRRAAAAVDTIENPEDIMTLDHARGAETLVEEEQFVVFRLANE